MDDDKSKREPLKLVSLSNWVVLGGFALIAASIIGWTFLGSIPIRVEGRGVILNVNQKVPPSQALGLIPFPASEQLEVGMDVEVKVRGIDETEYGRIRGKIAALLPLKSDQVKDLLFELKPLMSEPNKFTHLAVVDLTKDAKAPSGFLWTMGQGAPSSIEAGASCTLFVTLEEKKPIGYLLP